MELAERPMLCQFFFIRESTPRRILHWLCNTRTLVWGGAFNYVERDSCHSSSTANKVGFGLVGRYAFSVR